MSSTGWTCPAASAGACTYRTIVVSRSSSATTALGTSVRAAAASHQPLGMVEETRCILLCRAVRTISERNLDVRLGGREPGEPLGNRRHDLVRRLQQRAVLERRDDVAEPLTREARGRRVQPREEEEEKEEARSPRRRRRVRSQPPRAVARFGRRGEKPRPARWWEGRSSSLRSAGVTRVRVLERRW